MLLYVLFLFGTTEAVFKGEVGFPTLNSSTDGCRIERSFGFRVCNNKNGGSVNISEINILPDGSSCILEHELHFYPVLCENGMYTVTIPDGSTAIYRPKHRVKRFFGILAAAIGIGCAIVCHHSHSHHDAPNRPPVVTKHSALTTGTPIYAGQGKTSAKVTWENPIIKDPEDGTLKIVTSPHQYNNGGEFSEGNYVIYFVGTDRGGLSVTEYLIFEVKVSRCGFFRWPENGYVDCGSSDITYGTTCAVKCKSGYRLNNGERNIMTCQRNGAWFPSEPLDCKPQACANVPTITNGQVQCFNNRMVYDNICEVVCNDGFEVHGMRMIGCNTYGQWGSMPVCKDTLPPRFLNGECPDDMQVFIDSKNNTAIVSWEIPKGEDNSDTVIITEVHGYRPGQRMSAGSHMVKYNIEDQTHNRGESCMFRIEVLTISCEPPNLLVPHLQYDCPESYRLGATCFLGCKSGYPMGGSNQIHCQIGEYSYPPKLNWKWNEGDLAPFCKETNCSRAVLHEPLNGALSCSEWTHGQMCQIQCESEYDVPNIGDSLFVCGRSNGKWRPSDNVPDCNAKIDVDHVHLPGKFYYYTGHCNSSTENIEEIKENFIQALNHSNFIEACIGVPECKAKYVDVSCGPISQRKRRDINSSRITLAYVVHFVLILKFQNISGKSTDDVINENKGRIYNMSNVIQKESNAGHFDLNVTGIHVDNTSYSPEQAVLICPTGTVPRESSATCVGCPKGNFMTSYGACEKCPTGTFQKFSNSVECSPCPENSTTTKVGADNTQQCLGFCPEGEFSPNGLAPCTKCPSNSYQPNTKSTKCIRCEAGKMTLRDGATSRAQCQAYDIRPNQRTLVVRSVVTTDAMTIFVWIYVVGTNDSQALISLSNSRGMDKSDTTLQLFPTTYIRHNRNEVLSRVRVPAAKWTNIIWSLNTSSSEVSVSINGKSVYKNDSFEVSGNRLVDVYDVLEFYGDLKVSALKVLPRMVTASEISSWSSTCTPQITGEIISMDDLVNTGNAKIIIPSICDDVDECLNSPCGTSKCINMLGDYKCLCEGGYTGRHCEHPPDLCIENMCKNNATCVRGQANYTCQCPYGYSGVYCQIKAVDGMWSGWSNWTSCSRSCGSGTSTRTRRCDSPPPDSEGRKCLGNSTETKLCEMEKCPECLNLTRSHGLNIHCKEMADLKRCTLTCDEGLYHPTPPLPYYECGVATGYKWNHQNKDNPTARLPSCTEIQIPKTLGVNFNGRYESISCTTDHIKSLKDELEMKLSEVECKQAGICLTQVAVPRCNRSEGYVSVSVFLHATEKYSNWALNITTKNSTASHQNLVEFVRLTLYLEKSAQHIMNNFVDFFRVTIEGTKHSLVRGQQELSHESTMRCPPGSTPVKMFCAKCPVGSYSDGKKIIMCPRGQYQDLKGQSLCKHCPFGKTTAGIGSSDVLECYGENPVGKRVVRYDSITDTAVDVVQIAVGVSVSVALLGLTVLVVFIIRRYLSKGKQTPEFEDNDDQITGSDFVEMPSNEEEPKRKQ